VSAGGSHSLALHADGTVRSWGDDSAGALGVGRSLVSSSPAVVVATWFTYQAGGKGQWLVMSNGAKTASGVYSGALQRTTGPAFSAVPFNPDNVARTTVGNATFTFSDANNGTFAYTVDGTSQSKPIARYVYSSPATVCR